MRDLNFMGLLFESMVIRDLRIYGQAVDAEVAYYQDSSALEVDAIVQAGSSWGQARRGDRRPWRRPASDAVQGALRDEDAAAPEGSRGLGDSHRPKAGYLADEPEAVQKATRLDRPPRPAQAVDRCQVLGQRPEVGIVAGIPGRLRPLRDGLQARAIVASQRKLVEELAHGVAEVLALANTPRHALQGLGEPLASRRVGDEPVRACSERLCHRPKDGRH